MRFLSVSRLRGEDHLLVLREEDGSRMLPVTVGRFEAQAIARAARRGVPGRPTTLDLLAAVIRRLGGRLERVVIHDLRHDTYFAQLELVGDRGLLEVDCRTSDGVALALLTGSPICAMESVLRRAAVLPRPRPVPRERDAGGAGAPDADAEGMG